MSDAPAVEARGLVRRFGDDVALQDVSFDVAPGELYGVIGPDGAGKTTLFRILVTLLLPDAGSALVLGRDVVKDLWDLRTRIGYMPGRFSLYPDLSVIENLTLLRRPVRHYGRGGEGDHRADLGPARAVRRAPRGRALRRHEAEARALLRPGAPARDPVSRRADHRRRRGVAEGVLGSAGTAPRRRAPDRGLDAVHGRGDPLRPGEPHAGGAAAGHRSAGRDRARVPPSSVRRPRAQRRSACSARCGGSRTRPRSGRSAKRSTTPTPVRTRRPTSSPGSWPSI